MIFSSINCLPEQFVKMVLVTQAKECIKSQQIRSRLLIAFITTFTIVSVVLFGFAGQAEAEGNELRRRTLLQAGLTFNSAAFLIYEPVFLYFCVAFFTVFKVTNVRSSALKEEVEASSTNLVKVNIEVFAQLACCLFSFNKVLDSGCVHLWGGEYDYAHYFDVARGLPPNVFH